MRRPPRREVSAPCGSLGPRVSVRTLTASSCRLARSQARLRLARVRSRTVSDTERIVVGGHTAALTRLLTAHVRAPAQELLDLALVGVLLVGAPHHRRQPQMLGELDHGL